ncbi:hypothetical protein C8R43DRAFT_1143583 [Mycena crocata]|nr:hypothetical protein C8R43DRAFT_1143583 [Mycena crocata]
MKRHFKTVVPREKKKKKITGPGSSLEKPLCIDSSPLRPSEAPRPAAAGLNPGIIRGPPSILRNVDFKTGRSHLINIVSPPAPAPVVTRHHNRAERRKEVAPASAAGRGRRPVASGSRAREGGIAPGRNGQSPPPASRVSYYRHYVPPSAGSTRVVHRQVKGVHITRAELLTYAALWVDGIGPPPQETDKPHRECCICHQAKSHPVSFSCKHSSCYVCIRIWLETSWTCPICCEVMTAPPKAAIFDELDGIKYDFPDWNDESKVDYSWEGLTFPKVRPSLSWDSD